jgi:hypothetical protein
MGRVVVANVVLPKKKYSHTYEEKQDMKCTCERNLRSVHATIFAVEKH